MSEASSGDLTLEQRKEIFRVLVEVQDRGVGVVKSRLEVASRFGVTEDQVRDVEKEGSANQWPPLD